MESIVVTLEKFEAEVLKADKPVVVILLPINYGNESDPSDDSILFFDMGLAEFKSEVQKTVGDSYKTVLVDQRYQDELNLFIPVPRINPPPITFAVYEKGKQSKTGFLLGFSKDQIFQSLKVSDLGSTPGNNPPDNSINGSPDNDILFGTSGNDIINGGKGNDVLMGLRGNDMLVGGDSSDVLNGGKGFDTLNGGVGNDILVGGEDNDVFVLGVGLGVDTIANFVKSQDTVQLINGLTFRQLSILPGTDGTLITVTSSGEVLASLIGVVPTLIGSEDFISL